MLIKKNLKNINKKILKICKKNNLNNNNIILVAVSKNQSIQKIKEAISFGQLHFGENYVKEAINKIQILKKYINLIWHFIGKLQSNKIRLVAENFSWCHSIDCFEKANELNNKRPNFLEPLNVLIQINLQQEKQKSGIKLNQLTKLVKKISLLSKLKLRGIMAIPKKEDINNLKLYTILASEIKKLKKFNQTIDTLSLGMSQDFQTAISAGSTMVRIGTAIFGLRNNIIL